MKLTIPLLGLHAFVFLFLTSCESSYNHSSYPGSAPGLKAKKLQSQNTANEKYQEVTENRFMTLAEAARSTFSVDVDTAAYANVRRMIKNGSEVPKDAVRIEEMINYFDYQYPDPEGDHPFSVSDEVSICPWEPKHQLVRIGIKGRELDSKSRKKSNLVFLIDVSGSMSHKNKLPLLVQSLSMLTEQLNDKDRIAIVVYAGSSGLVLPSTPCSKSDKIIAALKNLDAAGSTAGGEGLKLAYKVAKENYIHGGINRVILATDGDFNVGESSDTELEALIETKAKTGVFLSVLGFGRGNLNDSMMEKLSNKGNGNYAYIDTINEAKKVLVQELNGSIATIAKDVKLQVEFNPRHVQAFRLIGYENRVLEDRDFTDDKKDAGEIGAGHQVTALYEIVPPGVKFKSGVKPLKYQRNESVRDADSDELMTVNLRYKKPSGKNSRETSYIIKADCHPFDSVSSDFRFASAVAAFGMLLKDSDHSGSADFSKVLKWANAGKGNDAFGYRSEFVDLVKREKGIASR